MGKVREERTFLFNVVNSLCVEHCYIMPNRVFLLEMHNPTRGKDKRRFSSYFTWTGSLLEPELQSDALRGQAEAWAFSGISVSTMVANQEAPIGAIASLKSYLGL